MTQLSFEERYESICKEIDKRKGKWTLTSVPFEDIRQIILIHVAKKLDTYQEDKGEFTHWVNALISSQIRNELRNRSGKFQRPCIAGPGRPNGCAFNGGGDACTKTSTGIQCSECPAYRDWEKRKLTHFQVQQTLPLDNHAQEINNIQGDFIDIAEKKAIIDKRVMAQLTKYECKVYKMLYVQGRTEKDVGKALKLRKIGRMYAGYAQIRKFKQKVIRLAKTVIDEDGLA